MEIETKLGKNQDQRQMGERGRNRTREVGGSEWPLAGSFATPKRLRFLFSAS